MNCRRAKPPHCPGQRRRCAALIAAALLLPTVAAAQTWQEMLGLAPPPAPAVPDWEYSGPKGPEQWGDLSAAFAACNGARQSPVNLTGGHPVHYAPLTFRYRSSTLSLINDGRSLRARYSPGSYLMAGGREYELKEFHFHAPGEHRFNGVPADMELQLIHRDREGRVAIVAVPMQAGRRMNSILSRIWDHIPSVGGTMYYDRQMGINPLFLLPSERSYYSYPGSLTEPPCTEGVEWFVLTEPVEVDQSYIQRFLRVIGPNARPVQPLNGRPVIAVFRR